jgi:peptide/nickel transport system substrate-binding protein
MAVALAAAVLMTSACGADAPSADAQAPGQTLRVAGPFEVHSLEPAASSGFFTRLEVAETLLSSDLEGELIPGLATSWSASDDQTSWTFTLPSDVSFHDGTPLTPHAAAASLEHAADDAGSPLAEAPLEEVIATEDGVRFDLAEPYPTLPALLTHYSAVVLAPASYDDEGHVTQVVGTGPYEIEDVELPSTIEVVRSDSWRGSAPEVERISYQSVGRAEARALMAASDQADVVLGLEPAGQERVRAADTVELVTSLQPRTIYLKVNTDHPVLGDVRVRQALSLALDREAMATAVLRDPELGATQLFPPSLTAWNSSDLEPLAHDVDAAQKLLAQAGWVVGDDGVARSADSEPLRLTLTTYPDRAELPALATAIQDAVAAIGVELTVDVSNSSAIPAGHADGTLELALLARHFALVADPLVTVADTFAPGGSDWGAMGWQDDPRTARRSRQSPRSSSRWCPWRGTA